jgi:hypothetical protein
MVVVPEKKKNGSTGQPGGWLVRPPEPGKGGKIWK